MIPACRVCKSTDSQKDLIYVQGIFKCGTCGSYYRQDDVDINFYEDVDYWYKGDEELKLHQRSKFAWFEDYIEQGRSIEFGAADGDFTYLIRQVVDSAYDVCYSEIKDLLRPEYNDCGVVKMIGAIEDFGLSVPKFSNIFLLDVIEHLNDVELVFEKLSSALFEGGRLFIATNDGESFNAFNSLFFHREHTCVITRQGFEILALRSRLRIHRYFKAPEGWLFLIFERKQ
jgi:SAM-dependent methyltransferase